MGKGSYHCLIYVAKAFRLQYSMPNSKGMMMRLNSKPVLLLWGVDFNG